MITLHNRDIPLNPLNSPDHADHDEVKLATIILKLQHLCAGMSPVRRDDAATGDALAAWFGAYFRLRKEHLHEVVHFVQMFERVRAQVDGSSNNAENNGDLANPHEPNLELLLGDYVQNGRLGPLMPVPAQGGIVVPAWYFVAIVLDEVLRTDSDHCDLIDYATEVWFGDEIDVDDSDDEFRLDDVEGALRGK